VISEQATGYPGYDSVIGLDNATVGEILKDNGYSTSWFGKNHNTPNYPSAPDKPFFVYFVPGATHAPHQPKKEWSDKFKGKFDMGWNAMRDTIFANQKRLGVIPADAKLTPWPSDLPRWETLTPEDKKVYARQAEVFAGYVAYGDHEIGRVIQEVEDEGKLDNTLIIYIEGDNGTSADGSVYGTPNAFAAIQGVNIPVKDQVKYLDEWGQPSTYPHMSVAWSWGFDTPFKWTKQVASYFGAPNALGPGRHALTFDFTYDGGGPGKGGTGVLRVDGRDVVSKHIEHTMAFSTTLDETFDVGADTRTPIDDKDYQVPFRFTGKLSKLTIALKPERAAAGDVARPPKR
jgi:arylsulfatase A-like enzyme